MYSVHNFTIKTCRLFWSDFVFITLFGPILATYTTPVYIVVNVDACRFVRLGSILFSFKNENVKVHNF